MIVYLYFLRVNYYVYKFQNFAKYVAFLNEKPFIIKYGVEQFFANDFNASNLTYHLKYNYFLPLSQHALEIITGTLLGDSSLRNLEKQKYKYSFPSVNEKKYKQSKDFFLNLRKSNQTLKLEEIKSKFLKYKQAI